MSASKLVSILSGLCLVMAEVIAQTVPRGANIVAGEYFIGTDPGAGRATALTITSQSKIVSLDISNVSLQTGKAIYVRFRDANGKWSPTRPFQFNGYTTSSQSVTKLAEYFIGSDPGEGKATSFSVAQSAAAPIEVGSLALSAGQKISVRVKDSEGRWSMPATMAYPAAIVRKAEMFVAKNPSSVPAGSGTAMSAVDGSFNSAIEAIQGTLTNWNRQDSVWVRVQSSDYFWSYPVGDIIVYYPSAGITSLSPTSAARLQTLDVTVVGSGFIQGATTINAGSNIIVNSITVVNSSQLTANITVGANAATGPRDITVSNPAPGGGQSVLPNSFTVSNPVPTLASISPAVGSRSQTMSVTVNGSGYISGVTSVNFGANIFVNSVTVNSSSQLVAMITIDALASLGARDASVTNSSPGGGTTSLTNGFTVANPAPTLASISPNKAGKGSLLNVTLNGSNFISGDSVSFGSGMSTNSVTVTGATRLIANISISSTAITGSRDISVVHTTPGGGSATLSAGFTVDNSPAVSVEGMNAIPESFQLSQNYPNPFNPSTLIKYSLPKAAHVSLIIVNTLGQIVATLVNEHKEAGYYQIRWNATVPSGIYFYRLEAGEYVDTKKMTLLR
jgi:hypothetical protein